jgi:hypothetical protein
MSEVPLIDRFILDRFSRCGPITGVLSRQLCRASEPLLREITAGTVILEQLVKSQADSLTGGLHLLIVFYGR